MYKLHFVPPPLLLLLFLSRFLQSVKTLHHHIGVSRDHLLWVVQNMLPPSNDHPDGCGGRSDLNWLDVTSPNCNEITLQDIFEEVEKLARQLEIPDSIVEKAKPIVPKLLTNYTLRPKYGKSPSTCCQCPHRANHNTHDTSEYVTEQAVKAGYKLDFPTWHPDHRKSCLLSLKDHRTRRYGNGRHAPWRPSLGLHIPNPDPRSVLTRTSSNDNVYHKALLEYEAPFTPHAPSHYVGKVQSCSGSDNSTMDARFQQCYQGFCQEQRTYTHLGRDPGCNLRRYSCTECLLRRHSMNEGPNPEPAVAGPNEPHPAPATKRYGKKGRLGGEDIDIAELNCLHDIGTGQTEA